MKIVPLFSPRPSLRQRKGRRQCVYYTGQRATTNGREPSLDGRRKLGDRLAPEHVDRLIRWHHASFPLIGIHVIHLAECLVWEQHVLHMIAWVLFMKFQWQCAFKPMDVWWVKLLDEVIIHVLRMCAFRTQAC